MKVNKSTVKAFAYTLASVLSVVAVVVLCTACSQQVPCTAADVGAPPAQQVAAQPADHFWQDMFIYQMFFGGGGHTTVVQQRSYYAPRPPAPVVQNKTTNVTVVHNYAPPSAPAPKPTAPTPVYRAPTPTYRAAPSYSVSRGSFSSRGR